MSNIVLVGVGGSGLSGLAFVFHELGYKNIIGIDAVENEITKKLMAIGIYVIVGHGKYHVMPDDIVIYSDIESIKNGPEVKQAFTYAQERVQKNSTQFPKSNFPFPYTYNEFLGEISKRFITLAVAGSKGKSTTTAMMIYTLAQNEKNSNPLKIPFGFGIVGALVPDFGNKNILLNQQYKSDLKAIFDRMLRGKGIFDYNLVKKYLFVVEACEYKEHFLLLDVDYAIITNTYRDHKDYFKTSKKYREAYYKLLQKTRYAVVVLEQEGKKMKKELAKQKDNVKKLVFTKKYRFCFDYIFGDHNHLAASLVIRMMEVIAKHIAQMSTTKNSGNEKKLGKMTDTKWKTEKTKFILKDFHGVWRRMELLGKTKNKVDIYSDYAHTPESLKVGLQAIRKNYPNKHILCIFQPHQAMRIITGRNAFRNTLKLADEVIVYKLYTAREKLSDIISILDSYLKKQKYFGSLQNKKTKKQKKKETVIKDFDDIGRLFALSCKGQYITDFSLLQKNITKAKKNTIVVVFTAGDLDYKLRENIKNL